jgi:cytochrome c-type biogenesis protein CcmE
MKYKWLIGIAIILVFGGFAFYSFQASLSPYVSLREAEGKTGQVQVLGTIVLDNDITFAADSGTLQFYLTDDEGTVASVNYRGIKPDNFEESEIVVVVGQFQDGVFQAEKLLVKCPSKYEKAEEVNR